MSDADSNVDPSGLPEIIESSTPDFDWTEPELLEFLQRAWSLDDKMRVAGRIRESTSDFAFLVDLFHPDTGKSLRAPMEGTIVHNGIYIAPSALKAFRSSGGGGAHVVLQIDMSPLEIRKKRDDPLATNAVFGTLELLSTVPEEWTDAVVRTERGQVLMLQKAVESIRSEIAVEIEADRANLDRIKNEISALKDARDELQSDIERVQREYHAKNGEISELGLKFDERRVEMEKQFRKLTELAREKGRRLVALGLIEQDVMNSLTGEITVERPKVGHDFHEIFGGEISTLPSYIQASLWSRGLMYTKHQITNYLALLRTRDLIILAGDSGSGKTSLVSAAAKALGGKCVVIPVKPNWTSPEDLLGFYNPLERKFHPTQFLETLLDATANPSVPYFICLDEMNLARVEYYFADFLSLLEERNHRPVIHLYSETEDRQVAEDCRIFLEIEEAARLEHGLPDDATIVDVLQNSAVHSQMQSVLGANQNKSLLDIHSSLRRSVAEQVNVPPQLELPSNVWLIGAVNVDETTHYLSPKVLDRAHVVRFRNPLLFDWDEIEAELEEFEIDISQPVQINASDIGEVRPYPAITDDEENFDRLVEISRNYLDPIGLEFGLRAVRQSLNYLRSASDMGMEENEALNSLLIQKILPKLTLDISKRSTSDQTKAEILDALSSHVADTIDFDGLSPETVVYQLEEILRRATDNNGIANFWAK